MSKNATEIPAPETPINLQPSNAQTFWTKGAPALFAGMRPISLGFAANFPEMS